jgi:hypothetical protein
MLGSGFAASVGAAKLSKPEIRALKVRCHLRLGQWHQFMAEELLGTKSFTAAEYADIVKPSTLRYSSFAHC